MQRFEKIIFSPILLIPLLGTLLFLMVRTDFGAPQAWGVLVGLGLTSIIYFVMSKEVSEIQDNPVTRGLGYSGLGAVILFFSLYLLF